jgi:hypothetical protein
MLVAKLEIWPHGDVGAAKEIRRVFIANLGVDVASAEGDPHTSVYRYAAWEGFAGDVYTREPLEDSFGCVPRRFTHDRQDGPFVCLERAMAALHPWV